MQMTEYCMLCWQCGGSGIIETKIRLKRNNVWLSIAGLPRWEYEKKIITCGVCIGHHYIIVDDTGLERVRYDRQ